MRTAIGVLFGSSLIANAMLLLILVAEPRSDRAGLIDTSAADGSSAATSRATAAEAFDSREGALVRIERAALADARQTADRYWQASSGDYELEYGEAVRAARASVRDQLQKAFGPQVRDDPLFRGYFRPMDPMFHFLSSDEQLAIEQLKLDRDRQLQAAMNADRSRAAAIDGRSPVNPGTVQKISQDFDEALEQLLDESRLFEFRLRESATAAQLRSSRVEFTEPEFREAYRLLARVAGADAGMAEVIEARDGLRDLLGSRRFALLWSSRDPVWFRVSDLLAKNGVDEASADAVYQVINDFQDRKMRVVLQAEASAGTVPAAAGPLEDQERDAIARIVGEPLADEVLRSRALESFRMFRSRAASGSN